MSKTATGRARRVLGELVVKPEVAKVELRRRVRAARVELYSALSDGERTARARALARCAASLPQWRAGAAIASFASMPGEPDTTALNAAIMGLGATLWLPRVAPARAMEMVRTTSTTPMSVNGYGTAEPLGPGSTDPRLELIFVPGLAFASGGQRLGQGAGYYDRFIAGLTQRPVLVGVCDPEFLDRSGCVPPMEAHDAAMDYIVSASGLVRCVQGG